MTRQRKAFLNLDKNDVVRSNDEDRVTGAKQFVEYITSLKDGKTKVNAKRNNIVDLVSAAAFGLVSDDEHLLLDAQWNSYIDTIGNLPDMVAMVDVSGSMSGDPMMAAIGLGLCVANKSKLGRRVLTFSEEPNWINLDDCGDSFVSMVSKIINGTVGFNTNFYQALNMILDRIVQHKMTPEQVGSMVLVVFSDMQIDSANKSSIPIDTIMNQIRKLYSVSGIKICGVPYNPPHILFWNLRSTDNFPTLSSTNNTTMLSGYSPQLLNTFIKEGIDGLKKMTPYKMMECVFQNARYDIDTFGEANTEWQQACQHSTNYSDRKYIKDNALFFK
jgi:acetolactate synthase regulatory subunit